MEVKANERVFPVSEGIDFLGYVIYSSKHVELRKRIKQKMARKMHEVRSRKRRRELIASFYGMAKHANCNMLFNKLTGKQMKSFKDLKVAYKPEDGKKRFSGAVVSIRELVNLPIVVKDFETGIKTEQGEDRCIVAIEQNGAPDSPQPAIRIIAAKNNTIIEVLNFFFMVFSPQKFLPFFSILSPPGFDGKTNRKKNRPPGINFYAGRMMGWRCAKN